jgi:hypothetical protein
MQADRRRDFRLQIASICNLKSANLLQAASGTIFSFIGTGNSD